MRRKNVTYKKYKQNPHVHLDGCEEGTDYTLTIEFKDHKHKYQVFTMTYPAHLMLKMIDRFKFPRKFMKSQRMTKPMQRLWLQERNQALADGLFMIEDNVLRPNPSSIVSYYTEVFCRPIAVQIQQALHAYGMDNRRERIEMAMKFVQDIPYAIPYQNDPKYMYGGLITPPEILYFKFGDCDSKSFLFAGILTYLIDPDDIAFLTVPGHLFTVIKEKGKLEKNMVYVPFNRSKYVVAETAGPHRNNYGQPSQYKAGKISIHPLNYTGRREFFPYGNQNNLQRRKYDIFKAPKQQTDLALVRKLNELKKSRKRIKSMVFDDAGGWLIVTKKNEIHHFNMPQNLMKTLQDLQAQNYEITDVCLSDRDEYVVMYHNGVGFMSELYDKTGETLLPVLNELTEKHGFPVNDIIFNHQNPAGWIAFYGDDNKGFSGNMKGKSADALSDTLKKVSKQGFKSLAFTQKNGWVLIFGKNGHAVFLPKKLNKELTPVLKELTRKKKEINKVYFTPTDDWIIIYSQYNYVTSMQ